ncbi:hypothetical protein ACWCQ0_45465 [Streptomyces massasporeus]
MVAQPLHRSRRLRRHLAVRREPAREGGTDAAARSRDDDSGTLDLVRALAHGPTSPLDGPWPVMTCGR